ncbi:hypothetical protein OG564_43110 [Streptomyces sp. NBC_01280]|nr:MULTISPECIES: hypothetical protein [unclassified Streptomyces]WSE20283.1 hypothetical protein OG518_03030 [Streptomyces sp. NBC_01397]WSE20292.1 hypothetical protein OG518_41420 [Streptomyces sp. NBC_01397]WUB99773.1 hypothetical protein OHO83_43755 [Streptomyces sp. NBC_00569]
MAAAADGARDDTTVTVGHVLGAATTFLLTLLSFGPPAFDK